ncbi:hybrid sensor histidine kinase/response regulator [Nitrosomonas sp. HPC101]|uniref:hybrid sensor histidine kinase/response regulator n=1 Tax=Nitrosomonas sp. HPC101 TaxID=1658667 RepID=UPI00136AE7F7|nr:hybrid sensor histidine kinase/response regulator [Nitrosomonas sp. HPC101]MXS86482.1 hybrid sensor histidine kinase/response regulator [Nitrosomonas sp. HPC101]
MNTVTRINISSVMGIREAIEQIFTLIHRHFDSYAMDTDDTRQIEECGYYMHQLNGMLEMLELSGVAFVGISVEELLAALQEERSSPDDQTLAVTRQAIRSIYRYLDALIDGEMDNPVRLFPVYRKIRQVQGLEEISESDLFFPDVRESLPLQPVELNLDHSSRQEATTQARVQFQLGLLGWLKDADDRQSLQKMIEAVRSIEKLPASIEQRKFWWISSGFLDSLLHQEQTVDKSIRRLCGKIEQEIRHLNKESHVVAARLTRELLYRVARSQPVSERLQEISRVYDWEIPLSTIDNQEHLDESILDEEATASDLQNMRVVLEDINHQWHKFNVEDQENFSSLQALTEQFKALIARVNCPPLEKLVDVIHGALSYLKIRPHSMNDGISLDIASSLLLTENAIDNFYRLSREFPSQVDALATRIRAVTTGKEGDAGLPDLPNPDQAGHLAQEKKLLKHVAQEVLANLAQVEDILDRFFFEPEIRNDLPILSELFNQISGVLHVLELDQASAVLDACRALTEKLIESDHPIDPAEQILLADALSSLGFYIEALRNAQSNPEEILAAIIRQFDQKLDGQRSSTAVPEIPAESAPIAGSVFESDSKQLIDPELLTIFLDESSDVLASIAGQLEACYADHSNQDALTNIRRDFHTLKGNSRMVKLEALSEVVWHIEQLMDCWLSEQKPATRTLLDLLTESHSQFGNWCTNLRKDGAVEIRAEHLFDQIRQLMYGTDEQADVAAEVLVSGQMQAVEQVQKITETPSGTAIEAEAVVSLPTISLQQAEDTFVNPDQHSPVVKTDSALSASPVDIDDHSHSACRTTLRVDAALIDRLINESSESSIIRSGVEAQLYDLEQYLQDLGESVDRMRGQLRETELLAETRMSSVPLPSATDQTDFDPLELDHFTRFQELTRLMAESIDDVVTIHKSLHDIQRTAIAAVDQQAHLNRQLQQDLLRIRTIPFSHYAERLYRVVRQAAKDTGKQASLIIQGDSIEFDRNVLDKISSPLEHLLRNALVHGIELPEERLSSGKAEAGRITLDLHQEENEIVIVLQDDGMGLDTEQIREKARQLGLNHLENEQEGEQWYSLIFTHGFSTLNDVTDIAGRGVGLDIVRNALSELGGDIAVTSEEKQGVTFTLRFPVTLAVTQALMIKAADSTYAIPTAIVVHILEMSAEILGTAYQERYLTWEGDRFPLGYLPHLLGTSYAFPEIRRSNRIVLLQTGHERLAIHTDALIGQCEVVVKNVGPQLSNAPGIEGATITGDGSIVLIINPVKLLQREQVRELLSAGPMAAKDSADIHPSATTPVVMIVDDSLTVRKVTSRLLERQGYEILIAKDGVGALQLLRETIPAIMLVDIEMPHMDGFELIRAVRNNPQLQNIPIIIISSRTAEKHRKVAKELGVNEFMGKPYQEEELLHHIERLIKQ